MLQISNNIGDLIVRLDYDESVRCELNREIFESELYIILNGSEIVALVSGEIDGGFLIPVFNDYASLKAALKDLNDDSLEVDIATGREIISFYFNDDDFYGLAINPPDSDYILECESFIEL